MSTEDTAALRHEIKVLQDFARLQQDLIMEYHRILGDVIDLNHPQRWDYERLGALIGKAGGALE